MNWIRVADRVEDHARQCMERCKNLDEQASAGPYFTAGIVLHRLADALRHGELTNGEAGD